MNTNLPVKVTTYSEIMNIGKAFFESGFFQDVGSVSKAIVKIQAGAEMGIPAFAAMTNIYIIQGKPVLGSGLMASKVKASKKYDYRIIDHTEEICSIDFFENGERIGNSSFTIKDAKKAGTKNLEKFPRNMLFARAISNGVKWFCPDIFECSVYVPEEIEDIENETKITEVKKQKITEVIESDFQEVRTFEDWTNVIEKWISKKPELDNNPWFQGISAKYKPEIEIEPIKIRMMNKEETQELVNESLKAGI